MTLLSECNKVNTVYITTFGYTDTENSASHVFMVQAYIVLSEFSNRFATEYFK